MDLNEAKGLLDGGGIIGLLLLIVYTFATGKVVPKWVHDEVIRERDKAREGELKWSQEARTATDNSERLILILQQSRYETSSRRFEEHQSQITPTTTMNG